MFLKKNRFYLFGALLAAAAYAAAHVFFISPLKADAEQELESCRRLLRDIEGYYRQSEGMIPIGEARQRLDADARAGKELRNRAMQINFNMPAEFAVPKDWEPNVYFDKMLKEVVGRSGSAIQFVGKDAGVIGFTQRFLDRKEDVNLRFRRLAVTARFLEAMRAAGVGRLVAVQHGRAAPFGVPDVNLHIEAVNAQITVQSPEKNFVALLYELQQPGRYLAVRGVRIGVGDPTSGMFDATVSVSGLFVVPGPYVPPRPEGLIPVVPLDKY